jgi:glucose/arabinose dehydrogenase
MNTRLFLIWNRFLTFGTIALVTLWLAGCGNGRQAPPPILPAVQQPDVTVAPNSTDIPDVDAPEPELSEAEAVMPEPTISESDSQTVTFNPDEGNIGLQPLVSALTKPLFVTHAGDGSGRIFVVEQGGTIRILETGEQLTTPFLDISERVNDGSNEQGLLGLAFAPDYKESGFFFVNYTDENGDTVVARFLVSAEDANRADADSESIILSIDQPASNHNGGMVAFGPDGYLYVGTGDGGAANDRFGNGQNPQSLLGKMLRIDVTTEPTAPYTIPRDNPWVETDWAGQEVLDEIWAVGLRNPWRYSFDRSTGDLWIGDVGQNQYEEVDYVPAATRPPINFGWPIMEATHCFGSADCVQAGLWMPVAETDHQGNCSLTGGYVYRGQAFPQLNGVYLFGDYCSGKIWATLSDPDTVQSESSAAQDAADSLGCWRTVELLDTDLSLNSFGEDEAGELYVADHRGGTVSQIVIPGSTKE